MTKLYSARIEKFKAKEKNDFRVRFEIDTQSIYYILGIKHGDFIYDILTERKYPILKKLNNGLIEPNSDITTDKEYATCINQFHNQSLIKNFILQVAANKTEKNIIKQKVKR